MCRGNLQYFGECGHEKDFHPTELCPDYSTQQGKCLGTLPICHQTVIHSPAICVACANETELDMKREFSLAVAAFENHLEKLDDTLRKEKDTRLHRALTIVRAEAIEDMAKLMEEQRKEFASFQKKEGMNASGRVEKLPHDWWNDEEVDATATLKSCPTFARD